MNSAKPFVCPAIGCNQQFANEDHLEVHRRKHEMSLGLRDFKSSLDTPVIADQTPTPTRFLKNCEEVGLFSELPNPFDAEFRKASELRVSNNNGDEDGDDVDNAGDAQDITSDAQIETSKQGAIISDPSLNTVITSIGETTSTTVSASPPAVSSTTHEEEVVMGVASVDPEKDKQIADAFKKNEAQMDAELLSIQEQWGSELIKDKVKLPTTTAVGQAVPVSLFKPVHVQQVNQPVQPQVQTIVTAVQQQQAVTAASIASTMPSIVTQVVQGAPSSTAGVVASVVPTEAQKVSVANVNAQFLNTIPISAPILLRLPNGQTIPVVPPSVANPNIQIPLAVSAVAEPQPTSKAVVGNTIAVAPAAVSEPADVKLKLKNALLTSQSQGNMGVMTQAVEVVTRQQQAVTSTSPLHMNKTEVTLAQVTPG